LKNSICCLLSVCIVLFPGCSAFVTSTQPVSVTATDAHAELFADGQSIGTGSATTRLKRNESHTFMAKTTDGRAGTAQVGHSFSTTGMLDLIGGIFLLVPLIGLLTPGAWDLDSTTIMIAVPPGAP
jgi:hypothetical protein